LNLQALHYLAPEQTSGQRAEPTPRTDLYATGAMLQEMLTGRPAGQRVALPSHVNPEVPPAADLVVLRCLARDPGGRYASAAELQTDLEKLEESLQVRMLPNLRVGGKSSHTWLIAGGALLVVAAAVLFFVLR
jgi:serine/threonine protein kinase